MEVFTGKSIRRMSRKNIEKTYKNKFILIGNVTDPVERIAGGDVLAVCEPIENEVCALYRLKSKDNQIVIHTCQPGGMDWLANKCWRQVYLRS